MKNSYQKLMEAVPVPAGLNERVLAAARRERQAESKHSEKNRARPMLRAAVCGVCALTLVLGSLTRRPAENSPETDGPPVMTLSFGLTAYAAGTGETRAPNANSGLAFKAGEGMANPGEGNYTGCLFRIIGEGIAGVSLSIDRGGLYRYQMHTDLTKEERAAFRQAMAEGRMATAAISQTDDGVWYMPEMTALGESVQEDYDPEISYGFWLPPEQMSYQTGLDAEADIDKFDGAALTVGVTFTDGTEQTRTCLLSSGKLRVSRTADGTLTLLPQLAGDDEAYVYGLYAVDQEASRWFRWPAEGANTVSMSCPFGSWDRTFVNINEAGEEEITEKTVVHNGIDIPAARGSFILAAAAGTVAETGFDVDRGNYVVLDHGDGLQTVYAACQEILVSKGGTVEAGQEIARAGQTGLSTGPHLCFQVWQDGEAQNPIAYFDSGIRDTLRMG